MGIRYRVIADPALMRAVRSIHNKPSFTRRLDVLGTVSYIGGPVYIRTCAQNDQFTLGQEIVKTTQCCLTTGHITWIRAFNPWMD